VGRVLVVEDDARIADLWHGVASDGHAVDRAETGPGGLDAAMTTEFDLIVLPF
jgi:DNA-binding response OmpR family regulator